MAAEQDSSDDERRTHTDSQRRDRRMIPRMSDPNLRSYLRQVRVLCLVGIAICAIYIVGLSWVHFSMPLDERFSKIDLPHLVFYSAVILVIAVALARFASSIASYLKSESQSKLVEVSERLFMFAFVSVILAAVFVGVHLISML